MNRRLIRLATMLAGMSLSNIPNALAEPLIARVCWMGNECVEEYLVSAVRHGDQVKAQVRDVHTVGGRITAESPSDLTISCKKMPPDNHANAVEYTRWMAVCKGKKTEWSPKDGASSSTMPVNARVVANSGDFHDPGACPFECCTYRNWVTEGPVTLYKEMAVDSAVAFRLGTGERVSALTGTVITVKPGQATVIRPMSLGGQKAKVGDVVELLTYAGEGAFKLRYRGQIVGPNLEYMEGLKVITSPESIWWVKVKNKRGKVGWSNSAESFGNKDACG